MKGWITLWANRVGIVGSCAILLGNVLLGNSVLISVIRAVVVGFALYLVMLILGSMVLNALMLAAERVAYKEEMRLTTKSAPPTDTEAELDEAAAVEMEVESQAVEEIQAGEPGENTADVQPVEAPMEEPAA